MAKTKVPGSQGLPLVMSVPEAARMLGVSRAFLYEMFNARQIKCVMMGRRRLIARTELERFVASKSR